jgi:hypothetical protein
MYFIDDLGFDKGRTGAFFKFQKAWNRRAFENITLKSVGKDKIIRI